MNLLHVDSSALGAHSVSRELGAALVDAWKRRNPGAPVVYRDLAAQPLPHWVPVADANDPAVRANDEVLQEFLAADTVVIGAPMYNFGIPSSLKAWIDRIAISGKTFRYSADGPEGLAGGKKIIVVSSRGGVYSGASPSATADFQEPYLRQVFGFLGITDIEFVRAEGVNLGPEQKAQALASARESIEDCARIAA
ncbi:FMN-dependent NADH-azoreductase [Dokdonella ginsengisoli]|uniref:FMN dependent NADH:quinone oxidoreductase n=1 Tax=Dokdonella ginsengisoli TaxID=363846 RepID=A0ABV9QP97_9GAMM